MHVGDDIFVGPIAANFEAKFGVPASGIGSPTPYGIGPMVREIAYTYVPQASAATAVCAAQAIAGAANALINGTAASGGAFQTTDLLGRAAVMVSTNAGDTTQTVTITGLDFLGNTQTETKTLNGTTIIAFAKAFDRITQVAVSAAMAGNLTVGIGDICGLPVFVPDAGLIDRNGWNNTLASDAGTFVSGVLTNPQTNLLGDPKGTYKPSSACDGVKRLTICVVLFDIHVGPLAVPYTTATRTGAFGVLPA